MKHIGDFREECKKCKVRFIRAADLKVSKTPLIKIIFKKRN